MSEFELDVERLDLLTAFVRWADDWLEEKARREAWPMMPGTMPPASFADRPAALNRELVALKDRAARLSVNEGGVAPPLDVQRLRIAYDAGRLAAGFEETLAQVNAVVTADTGEAAERIRDMAGGVAPVEPQEPRPNEFLLVDEDGTVIGEIADNHVIGPEKP